ncbi:MAG: desulfoferrodoxin [Ruminococcaceae bacterium]|nr:desulfoferrodoxin [Oscillospiraceae bacterium]
MSKVKFYVCEKCGNIVQKIEDSGVSVVCCGQKMTYLEPGVVEASREKHIPVITVEGNTVKAVVGSVLHPMAEEHHIAWIYLETDKGGQMKYLEFNTDPVITFTLGDEKAVAVYAYCNLHGLWKTEL